MRANNDGIVEGNSGNRAEKIVVDFSKSKKLKNAKLKILIYTNIGTMRELIFLTPNAKEAFNFLR